MVDPETGQKVVSLAHLREKRESDRVALYAIYPYNLLITYANLPYLAWVSFASVFQLTITYLNW